MAIEWKREKNKQETKEERHPKRIKIVNISEFDKMYSAVRPGAYSLSSDTRFGSSLDTLTNFFLNGLDPDQQFILYANREMMTNYDNFEDVSHLLFFISHSHTFAHPREIYCQYISVVEIKYSSDLGEELHREYSFPCSWILHNGSYSRRNGCHSIV